MQVRAIVLAAALMLAPSGARAADLVVWWDEGYYAEEDEAVREIITAFEKKTNKQVELVFVPQDQQRKMIEDALHAGQPPDFFYSLTLSSFVRLAQEGRLVDLSDALSGLTAQFQPDVIDAETLLDATTGRRGLFLLPMGHIGPHVHVWKSLLERAGFQLEDIPKQWEPFWSFWCDKIQPAVRKAIGRDDIYGIGLAMSEVGNDTTNSFRLFVSAYEADYVTRDGRLVIDEPSVRAKLIKVLDSLTLLYRKGCIPPDAVDWDDRGNNKAFLEQRVVMTTNNTLSIPNSLRASRPDDYYKNSVTIAWPKGAYDQPLGIRIGLAEGAVFRNGGHVAAAKEFVRFLVADGWLAHWLDFTSDRLMPTMPKLVEQPFWLDPGDPHRMTAAIQFLTQPRALTFYDIVSGNWRHNLVDEEGVWPKAIHRIVTEGVPPEQAVDNAIARVKQILSE
jgi:multiple sugar transport system substrate-binding protein